MPANRRTDADTEALRRLLSRGPLVNRFNHTHPQIHRIRLGHGASQKPNRPPRLHLFPHIGNPDSIPTETALRTAPAPSEPRKYPARLADLPEQPRAVQISSSWTPICSHHGLKF